MTIKATSSTAEQKLDILGGIEVIYELKNGETMTDGISDLACTNKDVMPVSLKLIDNEFITSISGTGTDFIKSLNIETNFYRKIKQGLKSKDVQTPKSSTGS